MTKPPCLKARIGDEDYGSDDADQTDAAEEEESEKLACSPDL